MAATVRLAFVLLLCWTQRCFTEDSRITISKNTITLTPNTTVSGTEVTVKCEPPAGSLGVLVLIIQRKAIGTLDTAVTTLVSAFVDVDGGKAELKGVLKNATASGSTTDKSISLVMRQASCGDEATYICQATARDTSGAAPQTLSYKDLPVEVTPGQPTITASEIPYGKSSWAFNDTLTLECEGSVGTVNTSVTPTIPEIRWVWEYKSLGSSWTRYYADSDISSGPLLSDSHRDCTKMKKQTSKLERRLTMDDNDRLYRCYVQRNNREFEDLAASHNVGRVTADGTTPDEPEEPVSVGKADTGAIVGGVIGGLIVIAVIVIIIYFVVIRRRQQQNEPETWNADGGAENVDKEPVPPYTGSADPSVVYSQPGKRNKDRKEGVTNKALDESDEKKHSPADVTKLPPDDNDDRRHGRRGPKDKKPAPYEPQPDKHDSRYGRGDRHRRDDDRYDDGRRGNDDKRRGPSGDGRRPRDADNYDNRGPRYDDHGQGRRNRGYENDNRRRGHHSSSEDGGTDNSYVNTSQYSVGDGDPTIGTAI